MAVRYDTCGRGQPTTGLMPCDEPDAPNELMAPAMFCTIAADCQLKLVRVGVVVLKQLRQVTLQNCYLHHKRNCCFWTVCSCVKFASAVAVHLCVTIKNTYCNTQQAQDCSAMKAIWGVQ